MTFAAIAAFLLVAVADCPMMGMGMMEGWGWIGVLMMGLGMVLVLSLIAALLAIAVFFVRRSRPAAGPVGRSG